MVIADTVIPLLTAKGDTVTLRLVAALEETTIGIVPRPSIANTAMRYPLPKDLPST